MVAPPGMTAWLFRGQDQRGNPVQVLIPCAPDRHLRATDLRAAVRAWFGPHVRVRLLLVDEPFLSSDLRGFEFVSVAQLRFLLEGE